MILTLFPSKKKTRNEIKIGRKGSLKYDNPNDYPEWYLQRCQPTTKTCVQFADYWNWSNYTLAPLAQAAHSHTSKAGSYPAPK